MVACVPAEIQNEHLPNTSIEYCRYDVITEKMKTRIITATETLYVTYDTSVTHVSSKFQFIYRISGSHSGGYEEHCLLGYNAV
jgi:hypothetical protein